MERFAPNELEKRVDEVLFYVWDPIGVNDDPCARAEYRTYVSSILGLLQTDKKAEEIADYLCSIESEAMGLPRHVNRALETAITLLQHKDAIKDGLA